MPLYPSGRSAFAVVLCLLSAGSLAAGTSPAGGHGGRTKALRQSQAACGRPSKLPLGDDQYFRKVQIGGGRAYQLYVPESYRPNRATALVLDFHYWEGSPAIEETLNGFETVAEKAGFVLARPEAALSAAGPSWSLYDGSDVAYVRAVLADIRTAVCIDPTRIYAAGMSQGGELVTQLTCRLPRTFAAVASVAMLHHPFGCSPQPTPIIVIVGRADATYKIDEGDDPTIFQMVNPGAAPAARPGPLKSEAAAWAVTNRCESAPTVHRRSGLERWTFRCPKTSEMIIYVHGGGHVWPGPWFTDAEARQLGLGPTSRQIDATWTIWRFFEQHRAR